MERRNIIEKTIRNMGLIYYDVSQIGRFIEEKMTNSGFEALGDSAFTWQNSTALGKPDEWLYKYFARAYVNPEIPKRSIGFCIHLGGYEQSDTRKFEKLAVLLPVISVSLLKMEQEVKKIYRQDVYDCLWCAGWYESYVHIRKISANRVLYGAVDDKGIKGEIVTYFMDLLAIVNGDTLQKLIVEPMMRMLSGDEEWVIKSGIQVVQIGRDQ